MVAGAAGAGPALALALFGPTPAQLLPPLLTGVVLGAVGFLAGLKWARHPLAAELARVAPPLRAFLTPS
jgi:hypothetical protein